MTRLKYGLLFMVALAACSAPAQHAATVEDKETARMAPVIKHYKSDAILNYEIQDNTIVLSADAEKWSELDEQSESDIKSGVLASWAKTWAAFHPRRHRRVRVLVRNYYGQEITSETRPV